MIRTMMKIVWYFSEHFRINLGKYAPYVFEKMIGVKGKKE